ncbi:sensor histidine kinase [Leptothoe spongobia]|uniref:histidine kinase n=1 Tax=Leptothoe spongobia TAU-MAC 1115 TaxID=1967444 RepID=A0A947DD61_9CYAN|nr:ATP-binding protein [Leptothoe spongobia]MBT9314792.1 GHKL domain-containing protein [Leptothoe spongobia TAU-MAC 1115]
MQDKQSVDPVAIATAFQALLKHHQTTCLLVNRQNRLIHICSDHLGLLEADGNALEQDVIQLLPARLKGPSSDVLKQAQHNGESQKAGYQLELPNGQPYAVTLVASLHMVHGSQDFLTLLIERVIEQDAQDSLYMSEDPCTTELIEVNERLRAKVCEQQQTEQALAQQAQALVRSNANLEEFAYIVSHDLQEPLRAMTAFSQLLEQRYSEQLDASAKRYITHIVEGGTRMKAMIDGILELSRISRKTQPTNSPTNLDQALATALKNLELIRLETQASITHTALPTLYVDQNHIVQLLQNLISNAIKFRGVELPRIHVSAKQQAHNWLFTIQDNGIGIPQSQQERIFKLFKRLHSRQEYQGHGIGLAICKKIVEHYQGDIWLTSVPGQGAVFYFTLADIDQNKA